MAPHLRYNQSGGSGSDDAQGFLQYTGTGLTATEKTSTSYVIQRPVVADATSAQANGVGLCSVMWTTTTTSWHAGRTQARITAPRQPVQQLSRQYQQLSLVQAQSGRPDRLRDRYVYRRRRLVQSEHCGEQYRNRGHGTGYQRGRDANINYNYGSVVNGALAPREVGFYSFDNDSAVRFDNLSINAGVYSYTLNTEAYLNDVDGSESLSAITLTGIPSGVTLMDGATSCHGGSGVGNRRPLP